MSVRVCMCARVRACVYGCTGKKKRYVMGGGGKRSALRYVWMRHVKRYEMEGGLRIFDFGVT